MHVTHKRRDPVLTIFYHFDPWASGVGGIDTMIRHWVRHTPPRLAVRMVGVGGEGDRPGRWRDAEFGGRAIRFLPVVTQTDLNLRRRIPHTLRYTWALARHGATLASDFMHFHRIEPAVAMRGWPGHKTLFFHLDLPRQLSAPRAVNEYGWRRCPAAYHAMERSLIGRFDEVVDCNRASLAFHQQRHPHLMDRLRFMRNCVDTDIWQALPPAARDARRRELAERLRLPSGTRFVLFAGRLQRTKNPLLALRAFAALGRAGVHLLCVGDGNLRDAVIADLRRLGLQGRVWLPGALPQDQVRELQRVSDVSLMTSSQEGFPLAALESLACGTPLVTTRVGEVPAFLPDDAGIVCDDARPEAIAAALRRVLDDRHAYPARACVRVAVPYAAGQVIGDAWQRWLAPWSPRRDILAGTTA